MTEDDLRRLLVKFFRRNALVFAGFAVAILPFHPLVRIAALLFALALVSLGIMRWVECRHQVDHAFGSDAATLRRIKREWDRDMIACGLCQRTRNVIGSDVTRIPALWGYSPDPMGIIFSVGLLPGQSTKTFLAAAEELSHVWHADRVVVERMQDAGAIAITAVFHDPLEQSRDVEIPS